MLVFIGWLFLSFVVFCVLVAAVLGGIAAMLHIGEYSMAHPTPYPNLPRKPARWLVDPTGRHQYRFWNSVMWTEQVSDDGIESIDPIRDEDVYVPSSTSRLRDSDISVSNPFYDSETPPMATHETDTKTYDAEAIDYLNELVDQQRRYSEFRGIVELRVEQAIYALETNDTSMALANLRNLVEWMHRAHALDDTEEFPAS